MPDQLRPLFDRVVIKELEPDRVRQSGLLVPPGSHEPPPHHGIVLAVGPGLDWWESVGVPFAEVSARGIEPLVKVSSLEWTSSARWGDTVAVDADLEALGRTSLTLRFTVRVGERACCVVRTTYVATLEGASTPWPDDVRSAITAASSPTADPPPSAPAAG